MKTTFKTVAVIITAVMSSSSFAAITASVANAEHAYNVAEHNYHAAAYQLGAGVKNSTAEAMMNKAGEMRAQAYANARVSERQAQATEAKTAADKTAAQVANPTPHLDKPDVGAERATAMKTAIMQRREQVAHAARYAGMNPNDAATGSINVDKGSLPSNTPVETDNGITTAGQLPEGTQVSVPHVDAILSSQNVKGGQQGHEHNGHLGEHSGNGAGNAAGTASAHGMAGGSHIGGGSAMGGGFHGSW